MSATLVRGPSQSARGQLRRHRGIDPGLSGAVALLDQEGALVAVHDTPVLTLTTRRGTRQEYDLPGLVALLAPYAGSLGTPHDA